MRAARLDPHEAWVLANATHFVACAFRGRGRYERAECASLAAAARRLRTDRPVGIYAVYRRHQACIGTGLSPAAGRWSRRTYTARFPRFGFQVCPLRQLSLVGPRTSAPPIFC